MRIEDKVFLIFGFKQKKKMKKKNVVEDEGQKDRRYLSHLTLRHYAIRFFTKTLSTVLERLGRNMQFC